MRRWEGKIFVNNSMPGGLFLFPCSSNKRVEGASLTEGIPGPDQGAKPWKPAGQLQPTQRASARHAIAEDSFPRGLNEKPWNTLEGSQAA